MINLYDLSLPELEDLFKTWKEPRYRAKQVWEWLYQHKVTTIDEMTNLSKSLREKLSTTAQIGTLKLATEKISRDGTIKRLYQLADGQYIESVLMYYDDGRRTTCISTQAGCAMGCVFCATGQMGFARNLSVGEIVEQVVIFARMLEQQANPERLSNVVFMGMGEPLHNYDATLAALHCLNHDDGLNIGQRHMTVSTVGLVPAMRRFANEGLQVKLAVSLHAANDDDRGALLPVNQRWPIKELIAACEYYIEKTGRRMTFEWALIHEETDTVEQAHELGKLLKGMLCHVNVIPLNPTTGYSGQPSDPERVQTFMEILAGYGVSGSIRVRRGIDINAGCGQLKAEVVQKQDIQVENIGLL